jgi:hypothetical protein
MKAFPCISLINKKEELGMNLRDYFAGKVVGGIIANSDTNNFCTVAVAELAYEMADAMMKAREQ